MTCYEIEVPDSGPDYYYSLGSLGALLEGLCEIVGHRELAWESELLDGFVRERCGYCAKVVQVRGLTWKELGEAREETLRHLAGVNPGVHAVIVGLTDKSLEGWG